MGLFRKRPKETGKTENSGKKPWEERPEWLTEGAKVTLLSGGEHTLEVVGESSYQDNLALLIDALAQPDHYGYRDDGGVRVPAHALLVAETNNPYDTNAISVWVSGHKVGYLPRQVASDYRPGLLKLQEEEGQAIALECTIVGRPGLCGVFLKHDPEDFGIESLGRRSSVPPPEGSSLRTGLSQARATDDGDDSYDLSWLDELPSKTARRIPKLRTLLENEEDPIDRHFMLLQLEEDLYKCRELWSTALDEYDEVAEQHHAEIIRGTRDALVEKFGKIPLIETYRQSAIRAQKAKDWESSLWWAQRGIEVYGDDPARPEVVEDLRKRVDRAKSKLDSDTR